jgi:hypothetical protein
MRSTTNGAIMSAAQAIGGSDPDGANDPARCFHENHIKYLGAC